jgi:N-acetyl-anhydromuramyl-L-alanine amidase AmpD
MRKRSIVIFLGLLALLLVGGLLWRFANIQKSQPFVAESPVFVKEESIATDESATTKVEGDILTGVKEESSVQKALEETKKEEVKTVSGNDAPKGVIQRLVGFGYEEGNGRKIDTVVLHSSHAVSGDPYDVSAVIALWKSYGVAPHYMIARDGTIYQLVADKNIAYHAGDSKMPDGRTGVNNFSIGVEILNTKTDDYTSAEYSAVKKLIGILEGKYGNLKVVGHDTIAPGRKTDPWNFDWDKL